MKTIGIIGGGNMGEAIIARTARNYKISVCETNVKRAISIKKKYKVKLVSLDEIAADARIILLAVKPQDIGLILDDLANKNLKYKLIISIAAGITSSFIEKKLKQRVSVVRTMPNMPALIGEGITALAKGKYTSSNDLKVAVELFNNIGQTLVIEEKWIDTVTAVSGSGPAYVFLFVEVFINAARKLGLKEEEARQLVYNTLLGSAHILEKSKDEAAILRAKVTSKGGTTQAAMDVFKKCNIEKIFVEALKAARNRARELAK